MALKRYSREMLRTYDILKTTGSREAGTLGEDYQGS